MNRSAKAREILFLKILAPKAAGTSVAHSSVFRASVIRSFGMSIVVEDGTGVVSSMK